MSKNKLALFSTPQAKQRSRSKEQVASSKTNCTLFSRHYIACQAGQCNLDSFFEHQNQSCPPSISDMGQLRQGSKSDIIECLTKSSQPASIHIGIDAKVLDGAAIVHMVRLSLSTFEEYSQEMILPYITPQLETVSRADIVWDRYLTNILKQSIIERTVALRRDNACFEGAPIPANWEAFLRSNANKDELFRYLSDCIHACETGRKVIISTNDETIVSTQNDMSDVEYLQPCSHEEADTRILLHVAYCARQGLHKLVIRTVDTYVVVLAIGHFLALRLDELWVRCGVGTRFRLIAIQEIF